MSSKNVHVRSRVEITEIYGRRLLHPRGPMLVAGLRLATPGSVRKPFVDLSAFRNSLRGFGGARTMADDGKTAPSAEEPAAPVVKTEKQLKKEAQKNAKLAKYNEKMAKQKAQNTGEVDSVW